MFQNFLYAIKKPSTTPKCAAAATRGRLAGKFDRCGFRDLRLLVAWILSYPRLLLFFMFCSWIYYVARCAGLFKFEGSLLQTTCFSVSPDVTRSGSLLPVGSLFVDCWLTAGWLRTLTRPFLCWLQDDSGRCRVRFFVDCRMTPDADASVSLLTAGWLRTLLRPTFAGFHPFTLCRSCLCCLVGLLAK